MGTEIRLFPLPDRTEIVFRQAGGSLGRLPDTPAGMAGAARINPPVLPGKRQGKRAAPSPSGKQVALLLHPLFHRDSVPAVSFAGLPNAGRLPDGTKRGRAGRPQPCPESRPLVPLPVHPGQQGNTIRPNASFPFGFPHQGLHGDADLRYKNGFLRPARFRRGKRKKNGSGERGECAFPAGQALFPKTRPCLMPLNGCTGLVAYAWGNPV